MMDWTLEDTELCHTELANNVAQELFSCVTTRIVVSVDGIRNSLSDYKSSINVCQV